MDPCNAAATEGLKSPNRFETAEEAEKALMNALMIYKAAKHADDKVFLRAYILECEIAVQIFKESYNNRRGKDNNNKNVLQQ